ncbi:hypothetical protein IMSAGC006_01285 [Muribaculaceae bacterium]|nr:hypothetical protein IMSAGC006_01285 [Muribaculaceae bacterium]
MLSVSLNECWMEDMMYQFLKSYPDTTIYCQLQNPVRDS